MKALEAMEAMLGVQAVLAVLINHSLLYGQCATISDGNFEKGTRHLKEKFP